MIVFIGMETSGMLRRRFQRAGYETYSCDLLPSEDHGEIMEISTDSLPLGRHLVGDVFETLEHLRACDMWPTLAFFHPDCTYHTLSGAWAFGDGPYHQNVKSETLVGQRRRDARVKSEADVERIAALDIEFHGMENPRGTIPTRTSLGPPTQVVQPNQFGHDASKATCLWLWGIPPLEIDPDKQVPPRIVNGKKRWGNQSDKDGANILPPGPNRWKDRSRTYPGIADALVKSCVSVLGPSVAV